MGLPPDLRRWVLRGADGVALDAVVEPVCRSLLSGCTLPDMGHVGAITPQCVRVLWFEGKYVDVKYAAETGRAEDCILLSPTAVAIGAYPTPDCAPPSYQSVGSGTDDAERWTRRLESLENGEVLYESVDAPKVDVVPAYGWNGNPGDCVQNLFLGGVGMSPWLPIPDWAADALPNPPYTVTWE